MYPHLEIKVCSIDEMMDEVLRVLELSNIKFTMCEWSGDTGPDPTLRRARFPLSNDPRHPESECFNDAIDTIGIYFIGNYFDTVEIGISWSPTEKMKKRISDKIIEWRRNRFAWEDYCCKVGCIGINESKSILEQIERDFAQEFYRTQTGRLPLARLNRRA